MPTEDSPVRSRATADDLMTQRRQAQEELERKRSELEKLLKLEDEARIKRSSKAKSAVPTPVPAPAAPPLTKVPTTAAMTNPSDGLASESGLDMGEITNDDLDQATGIPAEARQSPLEQPKSAPKSSPAQPLEARQGVQSRAASSEKSNQGELQLDPLRGRFEKSSPTVMEGENLDVPTFFRRRSKKG